MIRRTSPVRITVIPTDESMALRWCVKVVPAWLTITRIRNTSNMFDMLTSPRYVAIIWRLRLGSRK